MSELPLSELPLSELPLSEPPLSEPPLSDTPLSGVDPFFDEDSVADVSLREASAPFVPEPLLPEAARESVL